MLRGFILMLTLLVSTVSYAAQRKLPSDMDAAVLKQVELPYLKVSRDDFSWTTDRKSCLSGHGFL